MRCGGVWGCQVNFASPDRVCLGLGIYLWWSNQSSVSQCGTLPSCCTFLVGRKAGTR